MKEEIIKIDELLNKINALINKVSSTIKAEEKKNASKWFIFNWKKN